MTGNKGWEWEGWVGIGKGLASERGLTKVQKPYKSQEAHIYHRNLSSVSPIFSVKRSSSLEQGGIYFGPRPHRSPIFLLKIAFLQGFCSKTDRAKMRQESCAFLVPFFGVESILFICFVVTLLQGVAYIRSFACDRSLQTIPLRNC